MDIIWMCFSAKGIPNEIIIKILYQNKGLAHPLSIQIDKGLGWKWTHILEHFDELERWQKSYMLQLSLTRSYQYIKNHLICKFCDTLPYIDDIRKLNETGTLNSWTTTLVNLQQKYGPTLKTFICYDCLNTYDLLGTYR
jgi:hypothetical protein|tara:strand:+ start:1529 stop:1945 length:417 start_codon:yes stop_codon:yes gene_type:complete